MKQKKKLMKNGGRRDAVGKGREWKGAGVR